MGAAPDRPYRLVSFGCLRAASFISTYLLLLGTQHHRFLEDLRRRRYTVTNIPSTDCMRAIVSKG